MTRWLLFSIAALSAAVAQPNTAGAAPISLNPDVEIRKLLDNANGTFRIAKDPRTNELFTLAQDGRISRIVLSEDGASREVVYSSADHGQNNGLTGFAIGPDGAMYLTTNRRGQARGGIGALVRGTADADGNYSWESLDPKNPPSGVPLEQIAASATLAQDPTTGTRYAINNSGELTFVPSGTVSTPSEHGIPRPSGLFIDENGVFYLFANADFSQHNIAKITKGALDPTNGERSWFTLVETEPFEQCDCIFNHQANGLAVSPDNRFIFLNSGSRTDHGEVQDGNGRFPGMRETGLTTVMLRIPTDARDMRLPNDREALRASGALFAEGLRNSYDLAFNARGELFATENSADRDMAEEINWLREGHHYGFPWKMGLEDNPQQFPNYDPANDFLLPSNFNAVRNGYYRNDPTFPPPPRNFTDPIVNIGPDGDSFRDPVDGQIKDASDLGVPFGTLTSHRSPLGLVFDNANAMAAPFQGDGFVLSWTEGDSNGDDVNGPFNDASEDLLHVEMRKVGDNYEARFTKVIADFSNPIDAEIIGNRIYAIEWGGSRGLYEITFPMGDPNTAVAEVENALPQDTVLGQNYPNPFNPSTTIDFQLGETGLVELSIFNASGQKVRTLINRQLGAGRYSAQWDGRDQQGRALASGTYLYRLVGNDKIETKQLTLIK